MAQAVRFWDRHAEGYAKRPVADEESYQKKLAVTREYFRPDMEVMEFGCGTGSTAIVHAPYVKHIRATDISPEMIGIARRKAAAANVENVTFEAVTIEDMDVADGSLDAVMGHSILHLLEDKETVIAAVYRMLKPGGVFVSSTVCLADGYKWLKPLLPVGRFLGLKGCRGEGLPRLRKAQGQAQSCLQIGLVETGRIRSVPARFEPRRRTVAAG